MSRWAVVRNTYGALRTTTLETWLHWFPERVYGTVKREKPFRHVIRLGDVELDVWFLALDDVEDLRNLRSFEFTGVWFNELEFIPKPIFDEAESRTGRWPPKKQAGGDPTWHGVIADLNAPREDHWLPVMMGEVPLPEDISEEEARYYKRPRGVAYFVQPPGLLEEIGRDGKFTGNYLPNPEAENTKWLPKGFYQEKCLGKEKDWIDSKLLNRITVFKDGAPVWPMFRTETHMAKESLKPIEGQDVYFGLDFGRMPAAVFGQIIGNRWAIQHELIGKDMGATSFAPLVKRLLERVYPRCAAHAYGDPKGADKPQAGERSSYDVFRSFGIGVTPAPVPDNSPAIRIAAVEYVLNAMVDGRPRFLLSPACRTLKMAMAGAYYFRRVQGSAYIDRDREPVKNRYSHVADALQYLFLGAGEGRAMRGLDIARRPRPVELRAQKSRRRYG